MVPILVTKVVGQWSVCATSVRVYLDVCVDEHLKDECTGFWFRQAWAASFCTDLGCFDES